MEFDTIPMQLNKTKNNRYDFGIRYTEASSKLSLSSKYFEVLKNTGMPGDGGRNTLDTIHRKSDAVSI